MGIAPEPPGDPLGLIRGSLGRESLFSRDLTYPYVWLSSLVILSSWSPLICKRWLYGATYRKWQTLTKAHSHTIFIYFILSLLFISFFHRRKFWTQRTLTLNLSGTEVTLTTQGEDMGGGVTPRDTRQHLASMQLSITAGHVLFYLLWGDARQGPSYSPSHALT
jgi:TRAP-type C4-dicarboxylate transport system permease large subunit